jgi:hypothetical protein
MAIYAPAVSEHANPVVSPCFSWGVTHSLITAYPFVVGIKPLSTLEYFLRNTSAKIIILDSGIYSLIKDNYQGVSVDRDYLLEYAKRYVKMIKAIKWPSLVIEVDSHTILPDLDLLARIRGLFDDAGLADSTLFTWHAVEKTEGLVKLLKTRKRVAIAPREIYNITNDNTVFGRLVTRYKDLFYARHIHCLGTNRMGVQDLPDNFSFDTTSWASIAMYGLTDAGFNTMSFRGGKRIVQPHIHKEVLEHMDDMLNISRRHPEYKPGAKIRRNYITMMSCGLRSTVLHYESVRRKTPSTDMTIVDPLDYAIRQGKEHARNAQEHPRPTVRKARSQKRSSGSLG